MILQECSFAMIERVSISKPATPCSEDPAYSFTACVFNYIARSAGCQIHWIWPNHTLRYPECKTIEQMNGYESKLARFESMSGFGIVNTTKCPIRCRVKQFSFSECKSVRVTWKHDWSSAFYLGAERTEIRKEEEFWVFDVSDTLNGIGGAMGLFLGWSVLHLITELANCVKIVYSYFKLIGSSEVRALPLICP